MRQGWTLVTPRGSEEAHLARPWRARSRGLEGVCPRPELRVCGWRVFRASLHRDWSRGEPLVTSASRPRGCPLHTAGRSLSSSGETYLRGRRPQAAGTCWVSVCPSTSAGAFCHCVMSAHSSSSYCKNCVPLFLCLCVFKENKWI